MEEILLCTHDPILVKSLYGILRDKGHDVEIADHPALAVQMILKSPYYAVIIDCKSFGLSVEDAVQIMRKVSPEMPIIVAGGPESKTDALSIHTPIDLEEFRDVLNTVHQNIKTHITKEEKKMSLTPRETILKAFAMKETERVPVTLFGGGMWSIKDYGTSFEELATNVDKNVAMCVAEAEKIRSDIVYVGSGFNNFHAIALGRKLGVGVKYREIGAPDMTTHIVNSEEDLAKLDMEDIFSDPVVQNVMEATRKVKQKIGDKYLVTMTCWGPFTLAARFVGEEAFMKYTFKKPAFVEKMVDFCAELLIKLYGPLVNDGLEALSIADPTASGDLINPKQMAKFAVPPLKKISAWAKSKGVHTILHICGNTSDRLDLFPETGCSTIFFDQKVDIAKAKEALSGKMSFGGNVAPVHVLLNKTAVEVEAVCKEVIRTVGKDAKGFILVPGCDIPPTIPYENIRTMHDVALNWKY